jgi:hypothetical protein
VVIPATLGPCPTSAWGIARIVAEQMRDRHAIGTEHVSTDGLAGA